MPSFSPHSLKEGQVLGEDVYNIDSKLLFPAGTKLSEQQIEILMMWGVDKVPIVGEGAEEAQDAPNWSPPTKAEAERLVKERFELVKSSHPVVLALKEIAVLEAAKSLDCSES